MFFLPLEGILTCEDCFVRKKILYDIRYPLTKDILSSMRHIVFSEIEKLYSFRLSGISLNQLNFITENYMYLHVETKFNSLDVYHSLMNE